MSYRSLVRGALRIEPPLNWSEIRQSRFYVEGSNDFPRATADLPDVVLRVEREDTETDTGLTTVLYCTTAVPYSESRYPACTTAEDVAELRDAFPGHTVTGEIVLYGDDPGDIRRVVADENGVREERARHLWPDGTEVKPL